jgi:hypothetical protein
LKKGRTFYYAEILQRLGRKRAWVVSGMAPGHRAIDEVSLMGAILRNYKRQK